jgi:hypothetical protein
MLGLRSAMPNRGDKNNSSLKTRQTLITPTPSIFFNMSIVLRKKGMAS